jgi:hypothetical protein
VWKDSYTVHSRLAGLHAAVVDSQTVAGVPQESWSSVADVDWLIDADRLEVVEVRNMPFDEVVVLVDIAGCNTTVRESSLGSMSIAELSEPTRFVMDSQLESMCSAAQISTGHLP